ncbi:MAG: hypothetical protein AMXMBFR58_20740 [Phycisphaerae bacterium]|nr:hypothetical protein [Phycisphaerales bacterium]MCK6476269.1 DUF2934 domain-containing protein [Phycisphaerales bacterium]
MGNSTGHGRTASRNGGSSRINAGAASPAPVKPGSVTVDADPRERIRRRAYEIYLARGNRPGDAMSDWLQAERENSVQVEPKKSPSGELARR